MAQHEGKQGPWPRVRTLPSASVLAPGIREETGREFCGPLRPGIAGTVGTRAGAVADDSRQTDLGMDNLGRHVDMIGKHFPGVHTPITTRLVDDRGGRRRDRSK